MSVLTGVYCRIAGMDECRPGIFKKDPRVGFVEITAAVSDNPDQDEIGDQQKQESGVDSQPRRSARVTIVSQPCSRNAPP